MFVPSSPDAAFVVTDLGYFRQPPLGLVQCFFVGVFEIRYAHQLAVSGETPTVVGTAENRGVAFVIPTDFHAPMGA